MGPRNVATGEAKIAEAERSATRGKWTTINSVAPEGQRNRGAMRNLNYVLLIKLDRERAFC